MTYCPPSNSVQEYEFTALSGGDILAAGDLELSCGDSFSMPASATVCITVTDNDSTLSGDARRNELGDDRSWQLADIEIDGVTVEDNAKIYAEEYYVLHDQNGNCFYMVEIEVACSGGTDVDDFYAFVGDVPAAGAMLTVAGRGNVCGNWIDYRDLSAGLKWDLDDDGKVKIEAEDMALRGYKIDDVDAASGGEVIRLKRAEGEASVTFGAESGTYDLELAYIDENDGEGSIEIWVGDTLVHTVELDQNNNGNGGDWSSISTVAVTGLQIAQGDVITLRGTRDAWEYARIDALTFCASGEPPDAVDDAFTITESAAISADLLANDIDPGGTGLTIVEGAGTAPLGSFDLTSASGRTGTATLSGTGAVTFTFDTGGAFEEMGTGESDTLSFAYTLSDGSGGTDVANVTVTVLGENDGPAALDDLGETDEDTPVTLDVLDNDSDVDGDTLTVTTLDGQPAGTEVVVVSDGQRSGTAVLSAAGLLTFTPGADFDAMRAGETDLVTVSYTISDGNGGTAGAEATIVVNGLNDAPVALDDAYQVSESDLSILDILTNDSDPEGDDLSLTILSQPIEGSVSVNGAGEVVFDPGTDFLALSDGQTAKVTFDYQISDGQFTDTATVTVTVLGEGVCPATTVSDTEVGVLPTGQPITVTLTGDEHSKDGSADFRFSVSLGDLTDEQFNFVYVIDISGSTGVPNSFGDGVTVLDAQIQALQSLTADIDALGLPEGSTTITIIPFDGRAAPTDTVGGGPFPIVTFGDDEVLDASEIDLSLETLQSGGETNYVAAIFAATGTIQQLEAQRGDANNIVYFLSDGNPFPSAGQSPAQLNVLSGQLKAQADVHGIALGTLVQTPFLDAVDNTGGAVQVFDVDGLDVALGEAPFAASTILGAELTVFDEAALLVDTFQFTGADFDETPLGYELSVSTLAGLGIFVGDTNTARLSVDLDEDADGIADTSIDLEIDITGVLPLSLEF